MRTTALEKISNGSINAVQRRKESALLSKSLASPPKKLLITGEI
jgi:hypothetical protein